MGTSEVVLNAFYIMKGHKLLRASEWSVMMCVRNVSHRLIHLNIWCSYGLLTWIPYSFLKRGILRTFIFYCSNKDTQNLLDFWGREKFGAHSLVCSSFRLRPNIVFRVDTGEKKSSKTLRTLGSNGFVTYLVIHMNSRQYKEEYIPYFNTRAFRALCAQFNYLNCVFINTT